MGQNLTPSLSLTLIPTMFYSMASEKSVKRQLNSHFLPKPLKQENGPGHGERALEAKITVQKDPPPPSWVVLSTISSVLAEKQNLTIDCNFQFSIFRLPPVKLYLFTFLVFVS